MGIVLYEVYEFEGRRWTQAGSLKGKSLAFKIGAPTRIEAYALHFLRELPYPTTVCTKSTD